MPHNKFWMASAIENTSRPQWFSCDIGVRKKPSEDRGPKAIIAIKQPLITTTMGVRHPMDVSLSVVACMDIHDISGAMRAEHIGSRLRSKTIIRDLGHLRRAWLGRRALFASVLPN